MDIALPPPPAPPSAPATALASPRRNAGGARRSYGGQSPEARTAARRERLLDAGRLLFGAQGFHATTVRGICAEAGLTERYFYESFAGLPALYRAVYARQNERLMGRTLAVLAEVPRHAPLLAARAAVGSFLDFLQSDPAGARILMIDALSIDESTARLAGSATQGYADLIQRLSEASLPGPLPGGLDAGVLANGLVGANISVATAWVRRGFDTPRAVVLESLVAFYAALLALAGVAAAPAAPP